MMGDQNRSGSMPELETFFDAACEGTPQISDDLMARIMADAEAARPAPVVDVPSGPSWRQILTLLGGWPSAAGLLATVCAGVWIGYNPPVALETALGYYSEAELSAVETLDVFDMLLVEG